MLIFSHAFFHNDPENNDRDAGYIMLFSIIFLGFSVELMTIACNASDCIDFSTYIAEEDWHAKYYKENIEEIYWTIDLHQ